MQQNSPELAQAKTLRVANALTKKGVLNEAYILYDMLDQIYPDFSQYRWLKQHCARKLRSIGLRPPNELKNSMSTLPKQDACLVRALNTLITSSEIAGQDPDAHHVERIISSLPDCHHKTCLKANLSALKRDSSLWFDHLNYFFNTFGMSGVDVKCDAALFDRPCILESVSFKKININCKQTLANPKVTIFVSAFNAESTIAQAIQSLLNQTHKNLEIIICDDNSSDSTPRICADFAGQHSSLITFIQNKMQKGTYANRNMGLDLARGDFFTILDADDIAHPERVALQLDILIANPCLMGVIGHWVRLSNRGYLGFRNFWGGTYLHEAVATFMFRREAVMSKIGYWDEVMFSADTEFLERVRRVFGKKSVEVRKVPLCIASQIDTSLTSNQKTGISNFQGLSDVRLQYRRSWTEWHRGTKAENLYIEKGQDHRMFNAPDEMIPRFKQKLV